MKRFFTYTILLVNIVAALCLLLVYVSVYVSPAKLWIPALVGLAYPYIVFANIVFVLYWLFVHARYSLLSLAVVGLGYSHLNNYFNFVPNQSNEQGIVVCSYNVKGFTKNGYKNAPETAQRILDYLKEKKPDIVCLQEFSFINKPDFEAFKLKYNTEGLPAYADASRSFGPATLSKFPIINSGQVHFENTGNMIIYTDVVTKTDTLRIFNCHLESYRFTPDDIRSLDSLSLSREDHNMKEFRLFGSKLKKAFIKRAEQAEKLRSLIDESPYPVLVCGDFNDTPVSYTYHKVRGNLTDAFVESGSGIGNTYLGRLPSFRIDYILNSPVYEAHNFKIDHVDYSDHYPVSCILVRKGEE